VLRQSGAVQGALAWFYLTALSTESAELCFMVQHDGPHLPCLLVGSLPSTSPNWVHFTIMLFTEDSKFSSH